MAQTGIIDMIHRSAPLSARPLMRQSLQHDAASGNAALALPVYLTMISPAIHHKSGGRRRKKLPLRRRLPRRRILYFNVAVMYHNSHPFRDL
jgi:hypothetical protein